LEVEHLINVGTVVQSFIMSSIYSCWALFELESTV